MTQRDVPKIERSIDISTLFMLLSTVEPKVEWKKWVYWPSVDKRLKKKQRHEKAFIYKTFESEFILKRENVRYLLLSFHSFGFSSTNFNPLKIN